MPVAWTNVSGAAAPTGGAGAHESLRKVLGYSGARIIEEACLRLPLSRDDDLIAPPAARKQIVASVRALTDAVDALEP
jgi:hypothetical protein